MDVAARRHRSRTQRHRRHARPTRRDPVPDRRSQGGVGGHRCRRARSGGDGSGPTRRRAREKFSRAGVFRKDQRDLSADQQGDANGAGARRIAQSGTAADPRHVCRCRDRDRQRGIRARNSRKRRAGLRQPAGRAGRQGGRAVRAARDQARPSRRGFCRGPRRPGRGRSGGDVSQFPDRCRKQPEGGAEGLCRGSPAMIARLIAWSARNLLLVFFGTTFAAAAGLYALAHLPLDAIPDLSDTQVIVYTEYPGQAPQVIEDQVTYPLTTAMLTVPRSKVVRGFSFFGVSFVYVIFEDGADIYWARSRVLEYLNAAGRRLPAGVTPTLGPDATGVGWVYQYAVFARNKTLAELRSLQAVRFALAKAEGVAEVASVGGFVK